MEKWKEICKLEKDRNGNWLWAVYNGKELMIKQWPKLITPVPETLKEEVKEKVLKYLLDKEYRELIKKERAEFRYLFGK
jgi:hypothetical protein